MRLCLIPLIAALLGALSCGGGRPEDGVTELRVAMWADAGAGSANERKIFEAFEAANPDIRVRLVPTPFDYYNEKLLTLAISGDPPDVFWTITESLPYLATRGVLMDLTEKVATDESLDTSLYFDQALELCSFDGRLYALPRDLCCNFVFYNKDAFDAAGLEYPTPDWTWEDFRAIGKRLTLDRDGDGRTDQFAYHYHIMDIVYQNGGDYLSADGEEALFDSPETVEALQWWSDNIHVHKIAPRAQEAQGFGGDLFISGRVAMTFTGPWMLGAYAEQCDFEWDVVNMPRGKAGNVARLLGLPIAISSRTENLDEAWRLLKFLCYSEEAQSLQGELGLAMPSRRDIARSPAFAGQPVMPPGITHYLDTMENDVRVEHITPFYPNVKRAYESMFDAVNLGVMTPGDAAARWQREVEREIDKARRKGLLE